ncbi:hypothetical protein BH23VER1_BH23VER1_27300 [soil metagenome]
MGPAALIVKLAVAVTAALALALSLAQSEVGWPLTRLVEVEIGPDGKQEGLGFRARVPRAGRGALTEIRGQLTEDGEVVGTAVTNNTQVKERGVGRFNVGGHLLWFSTPDGSDPRINGRSYGLRIPVAVSPAVPAAAFAALLVACWILARDPLSQYRADRLRARLSFAPAWPMALAVVAVAGTLGALELVRNGAGYSDGAFAVNGMPYSDAMGWNELAVSLARGSGLAGGFEGHRPLYAVVLGAVYLVTGPDLSAAKAFNVACLAAAALFAFALAARATSRTLGLGVAAFIIVSEGYRYHVHTLLTEPLGVALSAASLFLFWRGAASGTARYLFAAGMLLAFANLARTFTLPALLPLAVVAGVAAYFGHGDATARSWRRGLVAVLALVVGTAVVIAPWVVRQQAKYGIASISANSADILYGAAMTEGSGHWSLAEYQEAEDAGIPDHFVERYHFFSQRFRETVMADPVRYIRHVAAHAFGFFQSFPLRGVEDRFYTIVFALLACVGIAIRTGSLSALAGFAAVWPATEILVRLPASAAFLACAALAFWRGRREERLMLAGAVAVLAGCAVANGLSGSFALGRVVGFRDWLFALVVFAGVRHGAILAGLGVAKLRGHTLRLPTEGGAVTARIATFGATAMAILCLVATAAVTARNTVMEPERAFDATPPDAAGEWVCRTFPDLCTGGSPSETTVITLIRPGRYRTDLPPGDDGGHWARAFTAHPFPRTIAYFDAGAPSPATLFVGGLPRLERRATYLLVGRADIEPHALLGHDTTIIWARALAPYDPVTREADWARALTFPDPAQLPLAAGR